MNVSLVWISIVLFSLFNMEITLICLSSKKHLVSRILYINSADIPFDSSFGEIVKLESSPKSIDSE